MDVSRIGGQNFYATLGKMTANQDRSNVKENNARPANVSTDVEVDISEEARKKSMEHKEYGTNSPLKLDDAFLTQEAREQRKSDFANRLMQPVEIDPLDNEFQILAVKGIYNEGTLERFVTDNLDGKMKNASLVADELGKKIRGTINNPNATVEERAADRETALKHVEYIAQNYFENPDEAKAFLDGINRFAENDILREKGYIVLDNSDLAPFKSYQPPTTPNGGISWDAYAKHSGLSSAKDIFTDTKSIESFYKSLQKNSEKWSEDIIKQFDEHEKKVTDIIGNIKNSLNETDVANSLQRLMKAF